MKYSFLDIDQCNMCLSPAKGHKVIGKRLNKHQGFSPKRKSGISVSIMKCSNCGLLYSNPQPIPESIGQHYDVDPENYWENFTPDIDESQSHVSFKYFAQLHDFLPGMKMLDVGAGTGKTMKGFANIGFDVYGIEPSSSFFEFARKRMDFPGEKLICTSIEDANLPSEFFDYIHCAAVLEHVYNPNASIKKMLTWLKKDGILHIDVPHARWLIARMLNLYYKIIGSDYVTNLSPMHKPYHLHEFVLQSFIENGKINNYNIEQTAYTPDEGILPKRFRWLLKKLMIMTNSQMEISVWVRKK